MTPADFEDEYGFEMPEHTRPLVFSCAAGIRSEHAMNAARALGYTNVRNYRGGSNEWFA